MKTIVRPVEPAPVLADPKAPGRWIWGREVPITDQCRGGNSIVSWWNDDNTCELMARYCPVEGATEKNTKFTFDGERWIWVVRLREDVVKKQAKAKAKAAALAGDKAD